MFENNKNEIDDSKNKENINNNNKENKNNNKSEKKEKSEEKQNQTTEPENKVKGNENKEENKNQEDQEKNCKERILQLTAEFDNYKKRISKDLLMAKQTGKADLMKELLLVLDEFELALIAIKKSNDENTAKGIELIYSNLLDILKKNGLTEIKTDGIYNPYLHEIILVQEDNTKKDGTIISVIKKGYMLNDILLRAASVIIAKNSSDLKSNDTKNNESNKNNEDNNEKIEDNKKENKK